MAVPLGLSGAGYKEVYCQVHMVTECKKICEIVLYFQPICAWGGGDCHITLHSAYTQKHWSLQNHTPRNGTPDVCPTPFSASVLDIWPCHVHNIHGT